MLHLAQRMVREGAIVHLQTILHMTDAVAEQENRREIGGPYAPISLYRASRDRRFKPHLICIVPIHDALLDCREEPPRLVQLNDLDAASIAGELVVDNVQSMNYALNRPEQHIGVAKEECVGDVELHRVLGDDAGVVQVAIYDAGLSKTRELNVNTGSTKVSCLVVAMHPS